MLASRCRLVGLGRQVFILEIMGSNPIGVTMIKFRNLRIWFIDQWKRKTFFRNFFITRNAWGAFSINSHMNQHKGEPKICYSTKEKALKAADKMSIKTGKHFSAYKCLFCDGYHIGKNRDNK